jgi:hypothetical protein
VLKTFRNLPDLLPHLGSWKLSEVLNRKSWLDERELRVVEPVEPGLFSNFLHVALLFMPVGSPAIQEVIVLNCFLLRLIADGLLWRGRDPGLKVRQIGVRHFSPEIFDLPIVRSAARKLHPVTR